MLEVTGPHDPRIRWWHGLVFFLAAWFLQIFLLVFIVIGQFLGLLGTTPAEIKATLFSPPLIAMQVLFTCGVLAGLSFGVPRMFGVSSVRWLGLVKAPPAVFVASVVGIAGVGFLVDEVTFLLHSVAPDFFDATSLATFNQAFISASPLAFVGLTLVVAAGPGIGEELFFRGFVLRAFRAELPAWTAIGFSSLLFGILHMDGLQGLGAVLIGVYLGIVALRTGSVWPGVAAHAVNNLLCALFARYYSQDAGQVWSTGHSPLVLLAAAAVLTASLLMIFRMTERNQVRAHPRL